MGLVSIFKYPGCVPRLSLKYPCWWDNSFLHLFLPYYTYTKPGFLGNTGKMRIDIIRAFAAHIDSFSLPLECVSIILDYAYDVRCGRSSVQYWFWMHEPQFERTRVNNESRRRPSRCLAEQSPANTSRSQQTRSEIEQTRPARE